MRNSTLRYRDEFRVRERQQAAVAHLGQQGLLGTDLSSLLDQAVALVAETLQMEYVKVLELLPCGNLLLRAGVGWKEGLIGRATLAGDTGSQAGFALRSGQPVVVEDLRTESRFSGPPLLCDHGVVSGLSVIIQGMERPFGVLGAHTSRQRGFTPYDIHFLQQVANVLGAAIERKAAEDAVREKEERYRSLYLAVSGGVVVQDSAGAVIDANETACGILGLSLGQMIGGTSKDHTCRAVREDGSPLPGESYPAMVAMRTRRPVRNFVMGIPRAGVADPQWILVNSEPLLDPLTGAVSSTVTTFLDITERKHAEEVLRFLAEASRILTSSLDYEVTLATVARLAVPGIADWCTVDMVQECGALHRLAVAHVDPDKVEKALDLNRRFPMDPEATHGVSSVLRTGRAEIYPTITDSLLATIARCDEHLSILRQVGMRSAMFVPLVARGRVLGAISLVAAESGRRYGPADLDLAEELAGRAALAVDNARLYGDAHRAIRVRDEFLSIAAHELRTPVTSVRGFAQLALRQLDRDRIVDRLRIGQALQVIDCQSRKLSQLVSQLLDVSRMGTARLAVNPQPSDMAKLVEDVVETARATASGHTLLVTAPPSVPALMDPLRMEQVVANLVDNAIKYSPEGGLVEIELTTPEPGIVRLAVRDHGIGIPPEHRQKIFDRFYQAHANRNYGGMGLGLYISREIITLHEGQIEVECPPEGGSRFVVTLPTRIQGCVPWHAAEAA